MRAEWPRRDLLWSPSHYSRIRRFLRYISTKLRTEAFGEKIHEPTLGPAPARGPGADGDYIEIITGFGDIVGDERFPDSQPEPELREDWEAGKAFGFLLLAGSIGSFIVSYWHFRLDLLLSIEAALIAFPGVAVLLIPFIMSIKWAIHKGFSPSIVLTLTIIATVPFLIAMFIVLYMMAVPVWICVIAIGIICGILLTMYDSAKRTRLK